MDSKKRIWLLLAIVAIVGGSVAGVVWYRSRPIATAALLKRLPTRDALVLYIDFAELRRGGILQSLAGAKIDEDPEYQSFARKIAFNWKEDLDSVVLASAPAGNFMFVRGRFDWKSLRAFAVSSGGDCRDTICRTTGSAPERRISFFPVRSGLMALAVSPDGSAVQNLETARPGPDPDVPAAPLWLSLPPALLKTSRYLPSGTRMFARSLEQAENVMLTFAPEGNRIAARLDVRCRDEHDASEVAGQLASATLTLRQMMEREHQKPGPADLAGILAAGAFRSEGARVYGSWPIERAFVESILNGGVS